MALVLLFQPTFQAIAMNASFQAENYARYEMMANARSRLLDKSHFADSFLARNIERSLEIEPTRVEIEAVDEGEAHEPTYEDEDTNDLEHPPIDELYEALQGGERIYDGNGGFYELVPIEEIIPREDLERVMSELNDDEYSIVTDFVLFNIDGAQLPTPRSHVVRHQRFIDNSSYFFRHVPNFNADGNFPPTNSGAGWRMQTWQLNINGVWLRAFCTQPGIASAEPNNNDLSGWNPSNVGLDQAQRETIGAILTHGYRNLYVRPNAGSATTTNWDFPSGSSNASATSTLDDAILVTQVMIQEVAAGQWTIDTITSGSRQPIRTSGYHGDPWRRLIATSEYTSGMIGGPTTANIGAWGQYGTNVNVRVPIGSSRRMNMYDSIRHDIYFFWRRMNRPINTSRLPATSLRPVLTLTWSSAHQMYRYEIDDRPSSGGTGTLRRFFGNRTSGSLGTGEGYRFCRGSMSDGVCNPDINGNRVFIYTRSSDAQPTNSPNGFMSWNPVTSGSHNRPVAFFTNPVYQNKALGAVVMDDPFQAHFRMEIIPRSRRPVRAHKYSTATNERLSGAEFELCRGTSDSTTTDFTATNTQSWCWVVTSDANGIADFPANRTIPSRNNANMFEGLLHGRTYRLREIVPPTGYQLDSSSQYITASINGSDTLAVRTFRNEPLLTDANVRKISANTGNVIPETVFELQRHDGDSWVSEFMTTNDNGEVLFEGLISGNVYRVREYSVPAPYILDTTWRSFTAVADETTYLTFVNERAIGQINVTKFGILPAGALVGNTDMSGFEFALYQEVTPNANNWTRLTTAITNTQGNLSFSNIALASGETRFRVTEIDAPAPWFIPINPHQIVTLSRENPTQAVTIRNVTFENEQAVGQIDVTKKGTSISGDIVGGDVIENTEFRLYREIELGTYEWFHLETLRTNANGELSFMDIALGATATRFKVVESDVPAPWIISDHYYQIVTLSRVNNTTSITRNSLVFTNEQARGEIKVTKNSETGMVVRGTVFRLTGNGINRTGVTNEHGYVIFGNLPLGRNEVEYIITEEYVPAPYILDPTPMIINLSRVNPTTVVTRESITQVNDMARGRIRIGKVGQHIVGFESYNETELDYEDGVYDVTPESDFEVDAALKLNVQGIFARTWRWVRSLFTNEQSQNPPHLTGGLQPTPRQGIRWVFEDLPVAGVRFNVYAREDIVLDNGVVVYEAGEFVGSYITDSNGKIESSSLFLGRYFIREIEAPHGFYIHDIELDFELVYVDQYTAIVFDDIEIYNELQEVEIRLIKVGEVFDSALGWSEEVMPLEGVQFGLFAAEDFELASRQILEAETLIADGFTDQNGELVFNTHLPLGSFYIQEMSVREFYVVDETRHYFEFVGDHQEQRLIIIEVNELDPIRNDFVRGSFEIIKISREIPLDIPETEYTEDDFYVKDEIVNISTFLDGDYFDEAEDENGVYGVMPELEVPALLPDVEFELWLLNPLDINSDEKTYVGTFITDKQGHIFVEGLIFGDYMLIETVAHYRHQLLSEPIFFTISYNHEHHQFTVTNYQTQVQILKVDDLGQPLAGAHFQILTYGTEEIIHEWVSTEYAEVVFALAHGNYILRETTAPAGFLLGGDIHFIVTDAEETIYIVAKNELDSRAYIATQAWTIEYGNQYFSLTDSNYLPANDTVRITHYGIRPNSNMAFRPVMHVRLADGSSQIIHIGELQYYTVENILNWNVIDPIVMEFIYEHIIDWTTLPDGWQYIFWSEYLYQVIVTEDEDGNELDYELDLIYEHNKDGSCQNQTLIPIDISSTLPQTGAVNGFPMISLGVGFVIMGGIIAYYRKGKKVQE